MAGIGAIGAFSAIAAIAALLAASLGAAAGSSNDLQKVALLPRNSVRKYLSYTNVMVLHYDIPPDIEKAVFKYKASIAGQAAFGGDCSEQDVSVYLKPGSFPVINPDGSKFPNNFYNTSRPKIHYLSLSTNGTEDYINVTSPVPGDWFAVAFIDWTDPADTKINQKGLTGDCQSVVASELLLSEIKVPILMQNQKLDVLLTQDTSKMFKIYIPADVNNVLVVLENLAECKNCGDIQVLVAASSFPTAEEHLEAASFPLNQTGRNTVLFWPQEDCWHYVEVLWSSSVGSTVTTVRTFRLEIKYFSTQLQNAETATFSVTMRNSVRSNALANSGSYKQFNLMRVSSPESFLFEYDLSPYKNESAPQYVNITDAGMTVLRFHINEIQDIGGTLTVGLLFKPDFRSKDEAVSGCQIIACLRFAGKDIPTYPDKCVFNREINNATIQVLLKRDEEPQLIHVPFPDPGLWFLTLQLFCDDCKSCKCPDSCDDGYKQCLVDCKLNCSSDACRNCVDKCRGSMLKKADCRQCDCSGGCRVPQEATRTASLVFSVASFPCISGSCGDYGFCNHYISGGFVFSACDCSAGYRGWDCSDDSLAMSEAEIVTAILLLTLSNLLFAVSVFFAYRRGYYTEAVAFFFTMFFSTFYHACDTEEGPYGWCMVRLSALQFCDFFCGLLCIWVTLVAMANLSARMTSLLHILGAVLLAFGTFLNKHNIWVFAVPSAIGIGIVGVSWGLSCRSTGSWFPAKRYRTIFLPIGAVFVITGLVCFGFLQTNDNYKVVHSIWHMLMAVSVVFLLPSKKSFQLKSYGLT